MSLCAMSKKLIRRFTAGLRGVSSHGLPACPRLGGGRFSTIGLKSRKPVPLYHANDHRMKCVHIHFTRMWSATDNSKGLPIVCVVGGGRMSDLFHMRIYTHPSLSTFGTTNCLVKS